MKRKQKTIREKQNFIIMKMEKKEMKMEQLSNFKHLIVSYKNKQAFDKSVMI